MIIVILKYLKCNIIQIARLRRTELLRNLAQGPLFWIDLTPARLLATSRNVSKEKLTRVASRDQKHSPIYYVVCYVMWYAMPIYYVIMWYRPHYAFGLWTRLEWVF